MKEIVIIGNGISGTTAARHIRKSSDDRISIISSESEYFYSRTALMYIYMGHMKFKHTKPYEDWFWKKNKINLIKGFVESIDSDNRQLKLSDGRTIGYDVLIIACGSKSNKFGWPGQNLKGVQGLYNLQDLESMEAYSKDTKKAVIVGGGMIGIEMAEMFMTRNIDVTFMVREQSFWNMVLPNEESALINKHIKEHHIDLRLETELTEIKGDENGRVKSVIINNGEEILCQFVGLTVGVSPNIDFLKGSKIETDRGVTVNEFLETNITDVYAIGDCVKHKIPPPERRPVEQVWYTGKIMGKTVAQTINGNKTKYQPGIWFNSAKFLEIEYQTYGTVLPSLGDNEESLYWENKTGKKCLRLLYDKSNKSLKGINVFGIRLRHEVCEKWIREKQDVVYVLKHLKEANFDPELYKRHEKEIQLRFENQMQYQS